MSLKIISESHMDHGIGPAIVGFISLHFADRDGFFIETVELPEELDDGDLKCGLHGPIMGDEPVTENQVIYGKRGERTYDSRMTDREPRPTRQLTVIAGPHGDSPCVLYTAFGGPLAPKEPGDPSLLRDEDKDASLAFWREHALTYTE